MQNLAATWIDPPHFGQRRLLFGILMFGPWGIVSPPPWFNCRENIPDGALRTGASLPAMICRTCLPRAYRVYGTLYGNAEDDRISSRWPQGRARTHGGR